MTGDAPPPAEPGTVAGEAGTLLARFADLTAAEPTRLGVASDLHLSPEGEGTWKAYHATEARLRAAVEGFDRLGVDAVLFTGDLTRDGRPAEFERFDEVVADLDAPFAAIPGNHDLPIEGRADGPDLDVSTFERRYTPAGEEFPFRWDVGGVAVLGLSSHLATPDRPAPSFAGRVSEETLAWLRSELERASHPLVTVHHDLPGARGVFERHRERLPGWSDPPAFENAEELVGVLAAAPWVGPVLTGHVHAPSVTEHRGVREFNLPALGSFPSSYLVFDVTPRGTTVRMYGPGDPGDRVDALAHGVENPRPMLAAAQLAGCPLADDFAESRGPSSTDRR